MAKGPVAAYQEVLSYERQLEQLPDLPSRPFVLQEDYPSGEVASMQDAKWRMQHWERERDARQFLSGYNASPWDDCCYPESPAQAEARLEEAAERRSNMYGLPDSPEDMPARYRDAAGKPFSGLRG